MDFSVRKMTRLTLCAIIFSLSQFVDAQYVIPDIKLEAFKPQGFRASIPDSPGLKRFAFHGKVNQEINNIELGELSDVEGVLENGFWVFNDNNVALKAGDVLYYWVFIQHRQLGYKKDRQSWTIVNLVPKTQLTCTISPTTFNGQSKICHGQTLFEDYFSNINEEKWIVEHYIPKNGPNFEFNSYENSPDTVHIKEHRLFITPIPKQDKTELRGILNLTNGCTSSNPDECFHKQVGAYLLPPVRSGKIRSSKSFKYGRVDVRAKLPIGDWIFPDISLIPVDRTNKENKLCVAYARGNADLVANNGNNIGGKLLFGGPVLHSSEPKRSSELKSYRNLTPFAKEMHTYTLIWQPGQITTLIDGVEYGKTYTANGLNNLGRRDAPFDTECFLTIGVGVGGINDFPDGFKSGSVLKPWINKDRIQIRSFFDARSSWLPTWSDDSSMQVEFVKVTAI